MFIRNTLTRSIIFFLGFWLFLTHPLGLLWQDQTLLYDSLFGSLGHGHTKLFLVTRREEESHRKRETDRKRQTERDGRSRGLSLRETLTVPLSTSLTRAIIFSTEEKPRWGAVIRHRPDLCLSLAGYGASGRQLMLAGLDGACFSVRIVKNGTSDARFDGHIHDSLSLLTCDSLHFSQKFLLKFNWRNGKNLVK